MLDLNSSGILLGKFDRLWNGTYNFKHIKIKIAKQRSKEMLEIVKNNELIKFEIILNRVTQFMKLSKFITIRTFKKFILKRLSIHNHCIKLEVENF
jgi:hypothetical protein